MTGAGEGLHVDVEYENELSHNGQIMKILYFKTLMEEEFSNKHSMVEYLLDIIKFGEDMSS